MMNWQARAECLERELSEARETIRQLRAEMENACDWVPRVELGLTPAEGRILVALFRRGRSTKEQLLEAVHGHRPDADRPELKIVDVFICKLRRKLAGFGVEIVTIWGCGYELTAEGRAKLERIGQDLAVAA